MTDPKDPRSIHRLWIGFDLPPLGRWGADVWRHTHPEMPLKDWTLSTLPAEALVDDSDPLHVANVARLWLLANVGGLWVDHDVIPLRPLPVTYPWTAALGGRREGAVLCFPEAGHPFMVEALQKALSRSAAPRLFRSGAGMLEEVGQRHPSVPKLEVFSHDAAGARVNPDPLVVHLWATSHRLFARSESF